MAKDTPSNRSEVTPRRDTTRIRKPSARDTDRIRPSRPLRIALFAPQTQLDGITLYTRALARCLLESGNEVLLVAQEGKQAETIEVEVPNWHRLPAGRPLGFFGWRRLRDALREFAPDLVHAVEPSPSLHAVRAADMLACQVAVSVHGIRPEETPVPGDTDFDAYIASDQAVRATLLNECRLERTRTTLIPDCAFAESPPNPRDLTDTRKRAVIGWIGPLNEGSDYRSFVEAALKVSAQGHDAMFSILGDGPESPRVRELIEARGLTPRIVVIDNLYDYSRVWQPFDVVVVDSRQRAAALMVLNAMANGRPVITSEGGAVFDLIKDGVDGLIVPREDAAALAERILMLVQNPAERLRMAVAGYRKVEELYSPADMADALLSVYASMLAGEPLPKSVENRPRKAVRQGA